MKRIVFTILVAGLLRAGAAHAACAPQDPKSVVDAMKRVFAAMQARDVAAVKASFTKDFYAFDGGKRFDGEALAKTIAAAQAAGKVYTWTVNDADVRLMCDSAFIAYVDHGSITDAKGAVPVTWLESALLRYEDGRWRLAFVQSERVAPAP